MDIDASGGAAQAGGARGAGAAAAGAAAAAEPPKPAESVSAAESAWSTPRAKPKMARRGTQLKIEGFGDDLEEGNWGEPAEKAKPPFGAKGAAAGGSPLRPFNKQESPLRDPYAAAAGEAEKENMNTNKVSPARGVGAKIASRDFFDDVGEEDDGPVKPAGLGERMAEEDVAIGEVFRSPGTKSDLPAIGGKPKPGGLDLGSQMLSFEENKIGFKGPSKSLSPLAEDSELTPASDTSALRSEGSERFPGLSPQEPQNSISFLDTPPLEKEASHSQLFNDFDAPPPDVSEDDAWAALQAGYGDAAALEEEDAAVERYTRMEEIPDIDDEFDVEYAAKARVGGGGGGLGNGLGKPAPEAGQRRKSYWADGETLGGDIDYHPEPGLDIDGLQPAKVEYGDLDMMEDLEDVTFSPLKKAGAPPGAPLTLEQKMAQFDSQFDDDF